jgi:hypothetical protein
MEQMNADDERSRKKQEKRTPTLAKGARMGHPPRADGVGETEGISAA